MATGDPATVDLTLDWAQAHGDALLDSTATAALVERALAAEAEAGAWSFAVRFVDDEEMTSLHEQYLADASPTDIMTFAYDDEQGGDIVISVDTARDNAAEHGWALDQELRFLVLHGVLHVLGWDDSTDENRAVMLERQRELMAAGAED